MKPQLIRCAKREYGLPVSHMRHAVGVKCRRSVRKQRGLGIIEVLVALVIVSFGVLGMAGLQLTGMKQSTSGFNRSKALLLTENMATRMRINSTAARAQQYNDFDSGDVVCTEKPAPYCQAFQDGSAESCDPTELAAFDKFTIACGDFGSEASNAGIAGLLPNGSTMQISCDDASCVADSSYTISVTWREGSNASSDSLDTRQVQMRLRP